MGWGVVPGSCCSLDRETEMADAWKTCHVLPLWWFRTISRLFIRNQGGQKEVTQYFPSVERKELSTQNSITRENILQEWKDRSHQGYSNLSHHLTSTSWETSADANMKQKNHPVKPCSNIWPTGLWANKTLVLENQKNKKMNERTETSLVVHWLRIYLEMQGTWVRLLVGELRSHMPQGN